MGKFLRPYHPCRVVTTRGRKAPVITRMRRWIKPWRPRDWILTGKNSTIPLGGKRLGKSHLGGIKTCICYGGICGICLYIMANVLGHRMFTRKINGFWTQENGGGWFGPFSFSTRWFFRFRPLFFRNVHHQHLLEKNMLFGTSFSYIEESQLGINGWFHLYKVGCLLPLSRWNKPTC